MKLQRGGGTPQVAGPGLGAAELLRGEERQKLVSIPRWVPALSPGTRPCCLGAQCHV